VVARVQVEEEGNQRPLEARSLSDVAHESAPADLRRAFRIEKSEPRADDNVILRVVDLRRFAPRAQHGIGCGIMALWNFIVRRVRDGKE